MPQIRLAISAIIIATEPRGTPYISDHFISDGVFDADPAMKKAKLFFSKLKMKFRLETYDIALTMTTNNGLKCLYNLPKERTHGLPKTMPGKLLSQSDVCRANGYEKACHSQSEFLCRNVVCRDKKGPCLKTKIPVPEGTPCGSLPNMFCLRRQCTQIPISKG